MEDRRNAELARKLLDDSDGTIEDIARLTALRCHMTQAECEASIELAVTMQVEKLLEER